MDFNLSFLSSISYWENPLYKALLYHVVLCQPLEYLLFLYKFLQHLAFLQQ